MADQLDHAGELEMLFRNQAIAAARQINSGESRSHCLDCEEPIPEKRRQYVPGCLYCVSCAQERESGKIQY